MGNLTRIKIVPPPHKLWSSENTELTSCLGQNKINPDLTTCSGRGEREGAGEGGEAGNMVWRGQFYL